MAAEIKLLQAPDATFYSKADFESGRDEAIAIERAIKEFRQTGDEDFLWEDLLALDFDPASIEAIIKNPKKLFRCGYGVPPDFFDDDVG